MATPIIQAMIANPGGFYIPGPGDYYFAENLVYLHDFGSAIQNGSVFAGKVRIFGRGKTLTNAPGGGAFNGTTASGIGTAAVSVELYDMAIEGFQRPINLAVYGTDYSTATHHLQDVSATGYLSGIDASGTNNTFRNVVARDCGGGSFVVRPVGIRNAGPSPRMIGADVFDIVKGSYDTETMHYHVLDGGSDGVMVNCTAHNRLKHSLSFGLWFNDTDDFKIEGSTFAGMQVPLAGDLVAGDLRGRAFNYDTLSTLGSGPVLSFT